MQTPSIHLNEDQVGTVRWYSMPTPGVFYVDASRFIGYVLLPQALDPRIPEAVCAYGVERDGVIFIELRNSAPLRCKLLARLSSRAFHPAVEAALLEQAAEERLLGYLDCPEYFGTYPPPDETPLGSAEATEPVFNGLCLTRSGGRWLLSVAEAAQELEAKALVSCGGVVRNDYIFFDLEGRSPDEVRVLSLALQDMLPSANRPVPPMLLKRFPLYAPLLLRWASASPPCEG